MIAPGPSFDWPSELAARRQRYAVEEGVSAVRHAAMNELAAVGGLLLRLRRELSRGPEEGAGPAERDATMRETLKATNDRIAQAAEKLAFSRISLSPPRRPHAPLAETVARLLSTSALAPRVQILPCDHDLQVAVPPVDLAVALGCLLENALEASAQDAGGRASHGAVTVSFARQDNEIAVMVDDDAEAISDALLANMQEPFFSTRPPALGLGVNIARRIARCYGGELLLESNRPRGLRAELRFPEAGR